MTKVEKMIDDRRIKEAEFNYEELIKLKEHAKQYKFVSDKKSFLKSITPFEQKIILLNSQKPYEVLSYIEDFDSKNTNLLI